MDSIHKQMPALVSFLPVYVLCIGITFALLRFSSFVDSYVFQTLGRTGIPQLTTVPKLPISAIVCLPFALYAARTMLWNLMSRYEISMSGIRLLAGSLTRREVFYPSSVFRFKEIFFKQNVLEAPFGVGTLILRPERGGSNIVVKGVKKIKSVVKVLRSGNGLE